MSCMVVCIPKSTWDEQLEVASMRMDGTIQWLSLPATMTEGRTTTLSKVFQNQLFFYSRDTLSLDLVRVDKNQQWTSWEVMDPSHYTEKQNSYRSWVFHMEPMNPYTGERMEGSGFFNGFRPLHSDEETYDGPQTLIVYDTVKGKPQTYYVDEEFSEAREYGNITTCDASGFIKGGGTFVVMIQTGIDGSDEFIKKPIASSFYYYNVGTGDFQIISTLEHDDSITYFELIPHSLSHQENYVILSQSLQTVEDEFSFHLMVCPTEESSLYPTIILPWVDENDSSYNEFLCWID